VRWQTVRRLRGQPNASQHTREAGLAVSWRTMHASMGAASRSRSAANGPADLLTWPEPGELAAEQPAAATASAVKMPLSLCRPRTQRTSAAPHSPRAGCLPVPIPRTCPQSQTPNRQSPGQLPHAARRVPAGQRPRRPPPNQAPMSQSVTSPQTPKRALSRIRSVLEQPHPGPAPARSVSMR
jgi:hypothetical protein